MTKDMIKIDPQQFGLKVSKAEQITKGLSNVLEERDALSKEYKNVIDLEITPDTISTFRELRLQIRNNRTKGIEVWHKTNKEYFLRGGQFVDAIKRKECEESLRMEEQLTKAERHFEVIEEKRLEDLQADRANELSLYLLDDAERDLSGMETDVWEAFISTKKKEYEVRIAAELKVEAERVAKEKAEADERKRIRKENEQLKSEAEAKEKAMQAEREKAESERKALEAKAQKEREIAAEKARKEAEAKEKVEAELQAKKDAEAKAIRDQKESKKQAELAPDKEKLNELIDSINSIKIPELETPEAEEILTNVNTLLNKVTSYIFAKSKEL